MRRRPAGRKPSRRGGFTLTELLVVIVIIGIIITLILTTAMDGVRRAEERATQSLITKLESGLNDRLEVLLQSRPSPNYAHAYLAGVYPGGSDPVDGGPLMLPAAVLASGMPNPKCLTLQRAQVIATFDYIKAEMPDVYSLDPSFVSAPASYTGPYPLNFTGLPFPGTPLVSPGTFSNAGHYILPLGHMIQGPRTSTGSWTPGYGDSHADPLTNYLVSTHPELGYTGTGILGASYTVAAGLYKNMGYLPAGYDGIDNNFDGLVDDWHEGVFDPPGFSTLNVAAHNQVVGNLSAHKHNTARAEMLYAVLVEGAGPLGSVFNREDFTDKEVQDTDHDGLPEFVDAWGQPLQFFRWPVLYHSDIQRGQGYASTMAGTWNLLAPYPAGVLEQREQDPLDPNQQLVAPGWWLTTSTGGLAANPGSPIAATPAAVVPPNVSVAAQFFTTFFHRLSEPLLFGPSATVGTVDWDRSGLLRRAFFTKFLVLSGGQDRLPGVFLYTDVALNSLGTGDSISAHLIANENCAMPFGWTSGVPDVDFMTSTTIPSATVGGIPSPDPTHPSSYDVFNAAQDDITNQNLQSIGGVGGSG